MTFPYHRGYADYCHKLKCVRARGSYLNPEFADLLRRLEESKRNAMQYQKLTSLAELEQHAASISVRGLALGSSLHTVDAIREAWAEVKDLVASIAEGISTISANVLAAIHLDLAEIFAFDAALQTATASDTAGLCQQWQKIKSFVAFIVNWFPSSISQVVKVLANLADTLCPVAP